jgi:hypothetical protein
MKAIIIGAALAVAGSVAAAGNHTRLVTGQPAKQLMRALKLAGISPVARGWARWSFSASSVDCSEAFGAEGLDSNSCKLDSTAPSDAAAALLYDALVGAGVAVQEEAAARHVRVSDLHCADDQLTHGGGEQMFRCIYHTTM